MPDNPQSEQELLARAYAMAGFTLAQLAATAGIPVPRDLRRDKGWIGQEASARGRLGYVSAGGIIVELFFLSNPNDYAAWQAKKTRAIEALADVLVDHYG